MCLDSSTVRDGLGIAAISCHTAHRSWAKRLKMNIAWRDTPGLERRHQALHHGWGATDVELVVAVRQGSFNQLQIDMTPVLKITGWLIG